MCKIGHKQSIWQIQQKYPNYLKYDKILPELVIKFGNQYLVAKELGISQMTVCRALKRVNFKFDGRINANKDINKINSQRLKLKGKPNYKLRGRKLSKEHRQKLINSNIGRPSWNKGLMLKSEYRKCKICNKKFKCGKKKKNKFCGVACAGIYFSGLYSDGRLKGENNPMYGNGHKIKKAYKRGCYSNRLIPAYTRGKGGRYKDIWMRSSWEILYAKYLDKLKVKWEYEYKRFHFKSGRYYTPDFYLPNTNEFIEIKGYVNKGFINKFEIFKEEYPEIKITLITKEIWK